MSSQAHVIIGQPNPYLTPCRMPLACTLPHQYALGFDREPWGRLLSLWLRSGPLTKDPLHCFRFRLRDGFFPLLESGARWCWESTPRL